MREWAPTGCPYVFPSALSGFSMPFPASFAFSAFSVSSTLAVRARPSRPLVHQLPLTVESWHGL